MEKKKRSIDRRAIIADWSRPRSRAQIAARHGCSEQTITRIWREARQAGQLAGARGRVRARVQDRDRSYFDDHAYAYTLNSRIWQALLVRLAEDALGLSDDHIWTPQDRLDALEWFLTPSEDFDECCQYAGFDPEAFRERFKRRLALLIGALS